MGGTLAISPVFIVLCHFIGMAGAFRFQTDGYPFHSKLSFPINDATSWVLDVKNKITPKKVLMGPLSTLG